MRPTLILWPSLSVPVAAARKASPSFSSMISAPSTPPMAATTEAASDTGVSITSIVLADENLALL